MSVLKQYILMRSEIKLQPRTYWSPLEVKSSDEPPQAFQVEVPPCLWAASSNCTRKASGSVMILTVLFECLLGTTQAMLEGVLETVPVDKLAIHCHDTYGQALPNILTALQVSKTHIHVCMNYLFTESEVCMGKSRTETLPY